MKTVFDFSVKDRKNNETPLRNYAGQILLIVNTATRCGFTPQYTELEKLYETYHSQEFTILDFPCNQFGNQAPGTNEEIHQFCKLNYNTEFPQFKKINVNGEKADPLFTYLKTQKSFQGFDVETPIGKLLHEKFSAENPNYADTSDILWNFTKFLVDRNGLVVARFEPTVAFDTIDKKIKELIEK
jgi:glutathione peroxidase